MPGLPLRLEKLPARRITLLACCTVLLYGVLLLVVALVAPAAMLAVPLSAQGCAGRDFSPECPGVHLGDNGTYWTYEVTFRGKHKHVLSLDAECERRSGASRRVTHDVNFLVELVVAAESSMGIALAGADPQPLLLTDPPGGRRTSGKKAQVFSAPPLEEVHGKASDSVECAAGASYCAPVELFRASRIGPQKYRFRVRLLPHASGDLKWLGDVRFTVRYTNTRFETFAIGFKTCCVFIAFMNAAGLAAGLSRYESRVAWTVEQRCLLLLLSLMPLFLDPTAVAAPFVSTTAVQVVGLASGIGRCIVQVLLLLLLLGLLDSVHDRWRPTRTETAFRALVLLTLLGSCASHAVWRRDLERDPFFSVNVAVPVGLRALQGAILTLLLFYAAIVAKSVAAGWSELKWLPTGHRIVLRASGLLLGAAALHEAQIARLQVERSALSAMWFDGLLVMTLSFFTVLYTPVKAKTEDELQAEEDQRILAELYGDPQEGDESDEEMKQAWDKIRNLGPGSGSSSENGADPASPAIPPEDREEEEQGKAID